MKKTDLSILDAQNKPLESGFYMPLIVHAGDPNPYGNLIELKEIAEDRFAVNYGQAGEKACPFESCYSNYFRKVTSEEIQLIINESIADCNKRVEWLKKANEKTMFSCFARFIKHKS